MIGRGSFGRTWPGSEDNSESAVAPSDALMAFVEEERQAGGLRGLPPHAPHGAAGGICACGGSCALEGPAGGRDVFGVLDVLDVLDGLGGRLEVEEGALAG